MADTRRGSRPVTLIPPLSAQGLDRFAHFAIYHLPDGHLDVLGAGGMGTTYRAFDLQLERPVALKVIHPQHFYHPEVRSRFLREARAAARLQHPNIAGVLYQGEENGICFYAMELVAGEDLETYIHRVGPLDPVAALQICHQVLLGLDAAYQVQLLHRDLKPANIMLTRYHDHRVPHVKVIDFGLAKFMQDMPATLVTRAGFMGTPGYASPEQCLELPLDCRSDLYSLGSVLWYLLSGTEAFEGSTLSVIQAHVYTEPDYRRLPLEPGPVHLVLQRLLAKKPDDRPESPMQAIQEVEYAIEALGGPAASVHHPVELKIPPPGAPPGAAESKSREEIAKPQYSGLMWVGGTVFVVIFLAAGLYFLWNHRPTEQLGSTEKDVPALAPSLRPPPPDSGGAGTEKVPVTESSPVGDQAVKILSSSAKSPAPPLEAIASSSPSPSTAVAEVPAAALKTPPDSAAAMDSGVPLSVPATQIPAPLSTPAIPENVFSAPAVNLVRPDAVGENINSLGMKFVPLPFLGGDNWICVWETRLQDYRKFAQATKQSSPDLPSWKDPGFVQGDDHPVVCVSVEDADAFCHWLTQKERAEGRIKPYQIYRLPSRLELDAAKGRIPPEVIAQLQKKYPDKAFPRIAPPAKYPWGNKWPPESGAGNFADEMAYRTGLVKHAIAGYTDGFPGTSPVGSFSANMFGIFDLTGNVWEVHSSPDGVQIAREGGSWASYQESDFDSRRVVAMGVKERNPAIGFRCVLVDQDLAMAFVLPQQDAGQRGEGRPEPPGQK